jgi:hypothetical protein
MAFGILPTITSEFPAFPPAAKPIKWLVSKGYK